MFAELQSPKRRRPALSGARHLRESGIALIEVVVASALTIMVAVAITHLFLTSTKIASSNRVLTAARAIVQRNLDNAMALRWDSSTVPSILAITSGAIVYDDDGVTKDADGNVLTNKVSLVAQTNSDGTQTFTVIPGTLTRQVVAVSNTLGANIRRITFRLTYTFQGRNQTVEMSAIRAIDD